jgi:hypothetical protein
MRCLVRSSSLKFAVVLLLVAGAACAPTAFAQSKYRPCSMVSAAEAEALTGQKIAKTSESDIPYAKDANHDHADVISICSRTVSATQGLTLTVTSTPVTPEGKARGEAKAKDAEEKLKKQGAKVEAKDFGAIKCSTIILQGVMAAFSGTNCGAIKGGQFFSVMVTAGPNGPVSIDQMHALAEKILSRLP